MRYLYIVLYLLLFFSFPSFSQTNIFRNPFDFPILLSANFGELRSNHFHTGIDFKTQGVEGKPVRAVQGGYISRISVSPWGYGNVLYMNHPDGTTTVYGHLQRFDKQITAYVKEQQYKEEKFAVNLDPDSGLFVFKQGDVIGLSGNSGSSGGPHLHFEIRDTKTEEIMDPLTEYKNRIKDTRAPVIQKIRVYPVEGSGVVNGSSKPKSFDVVVSKQLKQPIVRGKIEAWGAIGLAVKASDYMDATSNVYGVKEIVLMKDSDVVFRSSIDRFSFDDMRFLNSFVDYAEWRNNHSFYMKSFIEPGNKLRFMKALNRGILMIDEEKTYVLSYLLSDSYGNTTLLSFKIEGKKQAIPEPNKQDSVLFHWTGDNHFGAKGIRLFIPRGNLYSDTYFCYRVQEDSTALAATHILNVEPVPLHRSATLSIRLQNDSLENKQQYGMVRIHKNQASWIGGEYKNGWINAEINELAAYTIKTDTLPPIITPIDPRHWGQRKRIIIRLSDHLSGVSSYRGEIDGQFVLFEFDGKKGLLTYDFDAERLKQGTHKLVFAAEDACGNRSEYIRKFVW
ncbi:MAG: M23 family metallopeptidase [Massilibacteroides sp.]|nr:M23 family metallopeptidase [Massilibacteroides sp.]MDD3061375.1 M23 family metallopeptidase [Massilibacteroides sp.]MDD4114892.1 M23 family metallopeptidase [Massilibacteroides sp.]MDD4659466.1 M23 family metallopeptidase [Massilibacteroides sp.]